MSMSMATTQDQAILPQASRTLLHRLHPDHPLHEVYLAGEFECDGCHDFGYGKCYYCSACDFSLHERCATCPPTLSSHLHPAHPLTRVNQSLGRVCDLCSEEVRGLYYTCWECGFNVHPLCTELPATVKHAAHPHHLLTLQAAEPRNCAVCQWVRGSWRYTCKWCHFDVHLECACQEPVADRQIGTAPVSTYHHSQYGYLGGVPSASPPYFNPYQPFVQEPVTDRQIGTAPVCTYHHWQYGYLGGVPPASPRYFNPYQPFVYPPIYSAMPINGEASMSTSRSRFRKRKYWILAKIMVNAVSGPIAGIFLG